MYDLDYDLEAGYEDRFYVDDAEEFERNQLALDNEMDSYYDDEYEDGEYDPDLENELV